MRILEDLYALSVLLHLGLTSILEHLPNHVSQVSFRPVPTPLT